MEWNVMSYIFFLMLLKSFVFMHLLTSHFCVLQIVIGTVYVCSVYWISDQPLELVRLCQFLVICLLIGFVSENLGLTISSRLDIVVSIIKNKDCK
jgi:hypothetical protein